MKRLHPYDVTVLVLVVIALLPIGVFWRSLLWTATFLAGTLVLRYRGHARASELSRATMVRADQPRHKRARP